MKLLKDCKNQNKHNSLKAEWKQSQQSLRKNSRVAEPVNQSVGREQCASLGEWAPIFSEEEEEEEEEGTREIAVLREPRPESRLNSDGIKY